MKRFFNIAKKAGPWVVAVLIFAYLFTQYKPAQIWVAVKQANLLYFLVLAIIYFIILYIVDCYTMSKILGRFGYPVSFRELLPARGVTYLIMNINYPASQAAFAYYLKRTRGVPIFEVLSVFFFIGIVDLYILMTVAFVGSFFQEAIIGGVDIGEYVRTFVLIAYLLFILGLAFWRKWLQKITGSTHEFRFTKWLRSKRVFTVFNEAMVIDYVKIAIYRSPIHIAIVMFMYVAIQVFYAYVPMINVISSVPIAFLIGTLPITPGGLGTTNYAIIKLLSPHLSGPAVATGAVTSGDLIMAVTISWMAINYFLKSVVALLWLTQVSKQLFRPTEGERPHEVESEATHLMGDI